MYRFGLVGNCQVRTYELLMRATIPDCTVDVVDFSLPQSRDAAFRKAFLDKCASFDYVFTQENAYGHIQPQTMTEVARPGRVIKVCNFYFRGPTPDICYIGQFEKRHGFLHYNSVVVLGAYLRGLSPEACGKLFNAEFFDRLHLSHAWDDSLAELVARDRALDFPGADFLQQQVTEQYSFHTLNHPTISLLAKFIFPVLAELGIAHTPRDFTALEDPLGFIDIPIHDFVARHRKLKYQTSDLWKVLASSFTQEQFIEKSFAAYASVPRDELVVNTPNDLRSSVMAADPDWLRI